MTALEFASAGDRALRTPRNYQALRDEHSRANHALDQHIEQTESPDKNIGAEQQAPGHEAERGAEQEPEAAKQGQARGSSVNWTDRGDMVSQQTSANKYNAAIVADLSNREALAAENTPSGAERETATAELNQHCDGQERGGQQSEHAPDKGDARAALEQHEAAPERGGQQIESENRDAARESLDQHIENPEPQQDIQPQPDIDRDI